MATSLSTKLVLKLQHTFTNALDLSTPTDSLDLDVSDNLTNGTAIDNADQVWHDTRTLTATSESLDLAGGLTNAFGTAITFVKVKGLLIHNKTATVGANLTIGGGANPFITWVADATDKIVLGPDGIALLWNPAAAGYAVTAGTGDILKIDSGAATIVYDIYIVGTTA